VLPGNILYRPKKGFGVPIGAWFREGMLDGGINGADARPLDAEFIRKKFVDHRAGRSDERAFLWNAWLLREWRSHAP
jgi:asparagine synthase (glutamine-hydrolysing)